MEGWICPKCGKVNAPWVDSCSCYLTETVASTTGTVGCQHTWVYSGKNTGGCNVFVCQKCGQTKTELAKGVE